MCSFVPHGKGREDVPGGGNGTDKSLVLGHRGCRRQKVVLVPCCTGKELVAQRWGRQGDHREKDFDGCRKAI